ncbi:MAG: prolipoprotein diacylglyceryl transferase, partial [Acholeplasmataceae bacterium]|nr:prolipoprotein diacylglyceryl transferase [Acholeplasmataceae bacterium]
MNEFLKKNKRSLIKYGSVLGIFLFVLFIAIISQTNVPYSASQYYNPTALKITDSIQIQWYAVFILTGLSLGAYLAYDEFKKVGWNKDWLFDALIIAVPLSIVGSRLYYVLFDPTPNYQSISDVIGISNGGISGLSIHGAVITALIFVYFW